MLIGCATPLAEQRKALAAKPICCAGLNALPYSPMLLDTPARVRLDAESPVYDFDGNRSFFAAYRLPPWSVSLELSILAGRAGNTLIDPVVMLLDDGFRTTRVIRGDRAQRTAQGSRRLTIFINEADRTEQYFVVYADNDAGRVDVSIVGVPSQLQVGLASLLLGGRDVAEQVPMSPMGALEISLRRYAPRRATD